MITIYFGTTGCGKTFCIQEELDCLLSGVSATTISEKILVVTTREEEWALYKSNPAIKILNCECEKLDLETLKEYEVVIFDSVDLYKDEFIAMAPLVAKQSHKHGVNVIVALMEYEEGYEQLFMNAGVINYMCSSRIEIMRIPDKFLSQHDKDGLIDMSYFANQSGGARAKRYMLIYRNGRPYMHAELCTKVPQDKKI